MKRQKQMHMAFGTNEFRLTDFPVKISNVQVSRIIYGNNRGCSGASPMCGRLTTQLLLTDSEAGNALEKQDGTHLVKKGRIVSDLFNFTNPYFSAIVISISIASQRFFFAR